MNVMKKIVGVVCLLLSPLALGQDKSEAATTSGPVTVCHATGGTSGGTPSDVVSECEKRDIARLFLIAGNTKAALQMLCNTKEARATFHDDYQDGHNWIKADVPVKCLRAVGVDTK